MKTLHIDLIAFPVSDVFQTVDLLESVISFGSKIKFFNLKFYVYFVCQE